MSNTLRLVAILYLLIDVGAAVALVATSPPSPFRLWVILGALSALLPGFAVLGLAQVLDDVRAIRERDAQ